MKILEQPNKPPKEWWVGKQFRCGSCKALIEFEERDGIVGLAPRAVVEERIRDELGYYVTFDCPVCGRNSKYYCH